MVNPEPFDIFKIFGIVLFLLFIYLVWGRPRRGMRLKLSSWSAAKKKGPRSIVGERSEVNSEKTLNVIFNYNGHSWDAHEVLGVPAGCSADIVQKAYQDALKNIDEESKEFVKTAFRAIQTHEQ